MRKLSFTSGILNKGQLVAVVFKRIDYMTQLLAMQAPHVFSCLRSVAPQSVAHMADLNQKAGLQVSACFSEPAMRLVMISSSASYCWNV